MLVCSTDITVPGYWLVILTVRLKYESLINVVSDFRV